MRVYKRGGVWWCAFTGEDRRSTGCKTREAADLWIKREERRLADPAHAAKEEALLVTDAKTFLDSLPLRKAPAGTIDMYQCKVGHLVRLLPPLLKDLSFEVTEAYFKQRLAEGVKLEGSTLYKEWVALRQVLKVAVKMGHWSGDIGSLRPEWVTQSTEEKTRRLTWEELPALVDNLLAGDDGAELADIARYCVASGARRAEVFRAEEGDADRDTNTVLLRGSKTEKAWKRIPIPPVFRSLIPERAWATGKKPTGKLLFPNAPPQFEKAPPVKRACRAARIQVVTYNDLRRTFGTLLVEGGMTNTVLAKLMRHSSTAMVDKFYDKTSADALGVLVEQQAALPQATVVEPPPPPAAPAARRTPVSARRSRNFGAVRFLYGRSRKEGVHTENEDSISRGFVGRAGFEPATDGLKGRSEPQKSPEKTQEPAPAVPFLYQGPAATVEDAVVAALSSAIANATAAGRWDVVAQLAKELDARRREREGEREGVVDLAAERARRGRP